jgi:hypothetical protein
MNKFIKNISHLTVAFATAAALAACSTHCGGYHHDAPKTKHHHNAQQPVVMYEMSETVVAEVEEMPTMKAKMYTRSSRGGTSEMGYIKFTPCEGGVKMSVDLIDLRPGETYVMKIYQCGNCSDSSCCDSKCMNLKLPTLSIDEPGRLTQTYTIRGLNCANLQNAKVVLSRDGGYKAAWGRVYQASQW